MFFVINPFWSTFCIKGHAAIDRNPGQGYNTLLLQLIPGNLYSACPHRQFYTLRGLINIIKPRIGAGTWPNKTRLVVSFTFAAKPGRKS